MVQRDYLLRQIEALGQLLIAIRKMILGGEADGAAVESRLREAAGKGGMDLELARAATPDTLRMLIAPTGEIEPGRCWLLAETLYLDGIRARLEEDAEQALDSLRKARMLFALLAPMGAFLVGFPEAKERMQEIDGMLADPVSGEGGG
ncbi:MAG: hypothetical protein ACWGSQ_05630 [Longimicrobiales bacterium]